MSILRQKKIILTAIIPLFLIVGLSVQSYATTVDTTTNVYSDIAGLTYTVNSASGITLSHPAYTVVLTGESATATPFTWENDAVMNTELIKGHWQFEVKVTATVAETSSKSHTLTVQVDSGAGYSLPQSLTFSSTMAINDEMTFRFDMGSDLPDGSAIVITIT